MPIVGSFAGASARAYGAGAGAPIVGDFESIATITAGSAVASIEFTSIPATYTHLQIRGILRGDRVVTDSEFSIQLNSDTATNYSYHYVGGDGASTVAAAGSTRPDMNSGSNPGASETASVFGALVCDILDYANTNKFKTLRTLAGYDGNGNGRIFLSSGNWRSTSAVTSIKIIPSANNWVQYSSLALYGVKA